MPTPTVQDNNSASAPTPAGVGANPLGAAAETTFNPTPADMGAAGAPIPDNGWTPAQETAVGTPQDMAAPTASGGLNEGLAQFQKWVMDFAETTNPFARWVMHPVHVSEEEGQQQQLGQDNANPPDLRGAAPELRGAGTNLRGGANEAAFSKGMSGMALGVAPERYQASLSAPPDFDYNESFPLHSGATASALTKSLLAAHWEGIARVYPGIRDLTPPALWNTGFARLEKKVSGALPDGGRWITVHPHHDPDEKGHPVYIVPNPDGSHSVVAGAGGKLNGLRLTGVKSPEEYRRYASTRRAEKERAKQLQAEQRQKEVGMAQYIEETRQKEAAHKEAKAARVQSERQFVSDVLSARGHDAGLMDIPKEKLAGMTEAQKTRLQNEHHRAMVSYANAVASGVEDKLRSGWGDAMLQHGDLTAGDIFGELAAGRGKGYQAGISQLAQDRGLDASEASGAAREASLAATSR